MRLVGRLDGGGVGTTLTHPTAVRVELVVDLDEAEVATRLVHLGYGRVRVRVGPGVGRRIEDVDRGVRGVRVVVAAAHWWWRGATRVGWGESRGEHDFQATRERVPEAYALARQMRRSPARHGTARQNPAHECTTRPRAGWVPLLRANLDYFVRFEPAIIQAYTGASLGSQNPTHSGPHRRCSWSSSSRRRPGPTEGGSTTHWRWSRSW